MDQSIFGTLAYIPGRAPHKPEPLSRYLPPIPDGVISSWLHNNIPPGSWILDPFCASPRIAIEAAHAGYRLLVTANNPIARFLLEMAANPPKAEDLKSTLAELAASYKADERMEPHIRSLYSTYCARCGQLISADAFLWEHGNPSPYCKIYTCPSCGDTGEHPCTPYDADRVSQFSASGLHKARALERVVASSDQDRIHVEQALSVYIPRALYALITIINKLDGLQLTSNGQKCLSALLLHAFDQTNVMWRATGPRERRRQLIIPRHFRENNLWKALEEGIDLWRGGSSGEAQVSIPVTTWPTAPPESGGICIYEGRLVSIAESLSRLSIKSVCAAVPRPNRAFWTLSALWAGWLWGREVVAAFKSVLHRQRYDWGWHTNALFSVFKPLANVLEPNTKILGLFGEAEPGFIASALVAAKLAGCNLEGLAVDPGESQAQIVWQCAGNPEEIPQSLMPTQAGIIAAARYLASRGEPSSYFNAICAALMNITRIWNADMVSSNVEKSSLTVKGTSPNESAQPAEPTPSLVYSTIYNSAREALTYRSGFLRFNIQDTANVDTAGKTQTVQETLFSLDVGRTGIEESEQIGLELLPEESETASEKERPTRSSDISESTLLWLREPENVAHFSISDSYELACANYLATHPNCTEEEINIMMCNMFTGLYTPDPDFIHICLESYGNQVEQGTEHWYIRSEDEPVERQKDLDEAKKSIQSIGERLDLLSIDHTSQLGKPTILWIDRSGKLDYWFFPTVSAAIGETVLYSELSSKKGFIVLPGGRANLVMYKLRRDPRLIRAFSPSQGNWNFLKFRHLRSLVENPLLNRENLEQLLHLDPLTYSTPQLRLI